MAHAIHRSFMLRVVAAILAAGLLGGFLGFASAQDTASGWLNADCAKTCVANGHDAAYCGDVCWVPDPAKHADADNLDWKCMEACGARGGTAWSCLASCRR